ncbi:AmmeMemoRadiSam system protein A [Candidatus Marinarcus aquaticus]|uniref:AMMECR1 domain-containing protein n=1 Tax=Candidatus Marinarcus aquaticus TaxID=2044504 RepID=A0A4Q0XTV4_9BACT|nr:AmmeMemoRadiSam system protein A [Candidatus Marinarcus aquaticus]RXJ60523.1 AMMECR1 domain-containing protein [Candidatus Marinarcus aquaticus]
MSNETFEQVLLHIARKSIKSCLDEKSEVDEAQYFKEYPQLQEKKATFVTLYLNGNLRGCIGSLVASRTLFEDIVSNAKAAAFGDPRFEKLTVQEFEHIDIELSILSEPQALAYDSVEELKSKVKIGQHGVVLKYKNHQATFLPQVWEQLNSFELFFEHLCLKAGLGKNCLIFKPEIYLYTVTKLK